MEGLLGRPRRGWEDNTEPNFKEMCYEGVDTLARIWSSRMFYFIAKYVNIQFTVLFHFLMIYCNIFLAWVRSIGSKCVVVWRFAIDRPVIGVRIVCEYSACLWRWFASDAVFKPACYHIHPHHLHVTDVQYPSYEDPLFVNCILPFYDHSTRFSAQPWLIWAHCGAMRGVSSCTLIAFTG